MFEFLKNTNKQGIKASFSIYKIPALKITPLIVCESLNAPVLLESAFLKTGKGRFSILILKEAFRIIKENDEVFLLENSQKHALKNLCKIGDFSLPSKPKFLDFLDAFRRLSPNPFASNSVVESSNQIISSDEIESLPLPLGGVGYLGYEFFGEIEEVEFQKDALYEASENAFIFGRDFVVFDHFFESLYIVSVAYEGESQRQNTAQRVQELAHTLEHLNLQDTLKQTYISKITSKDKESYYTQMVKTLQNEIYKGNLLQCVPSQSLEITSDLPPLQAYENLRTHNPSPYMYYFDFGNYQIIGSSPEVLIKVKTTAPKEATLTIRPIAGTQGRGKNALEDSKLEEELKANAKENAEHLMLLDLGRNDVGKVARPRSVKVTQEKVIEKYARVMHLVSEVQGVMDLESHRKIDALYSAFPAGTVSGAPKIQAIKTIESLESHKRAIYAGAIGYFSQNGDMDFAIAIRTAVYQKGVYYLQAGGGIVYDSNPKEEYIETQNKMRSLLEAILGEKV
ncbi:anthranilate synthase component I family protein [Helicobacter sp. MIT 11-5569]|uniref:anthranilate synthase component I family protein n=1 Tax=Helicobacter sp. MIT 11-5569 TaxID=1548151 RepID=UPI00051F8D49|nr:chorismate-binding protein [Helicobacter sp. MIT 11-5569]TLD85202.1 anthranilate synthase component I family protein [Helicobacter sp. MIT 11-5569]